MLVKRDVTYILSFHPGEGPSPLVIGAWKKFLIVRLGRRSPTGGQQYREIDVGNAFTPGETAVVTIVTGPGGTAVYLDGEEHRSLPDAFFDAGDGDLGTLLLGTGPTASSGWRGDLKGLTIHGSALDKKQVQASYKAFGQEEDGERSFLHPVARYDFRMGSGQVVQDRSGHGRDLEIPRVFTPLQRVFLSSQGNALRWTRSAAGDLILNLLGFIPFGFLGGWNACARRVQPHARISRGVVLSGFALSLAIELLQAYLPSRSSSLIDLCTNTTGTAIGVALFFLLGQVKPGMFKPHCSQPTGQASTLSSSPQDEDC
jgi:hypothetical protein